MSRAEDHTFVDLDTSAVRASIVSMYEGITGETLSESSPESLFVDWIVSVIQNERAMINYAANQNLPRSAEGENLDALAELFGIGSRPGAKKAKCVVRFTIPTITTRIVIPEGFKVTTSNASVIFETVRDVFATPGDSYVDIMCECQTAGKAWNGIAAGSINTLVDQSSVITACSSTTETYGGSDIATDDEMYQYMLDSAAKVVTTGTKSAYESAAIESSDAVMDACAYSTAAGSVTIRIIGQNAEGMGSVTPIVSSVITAVSAACSADSVKPLTDTVSVQAAVAKNVTGTLTYYVASGSTRGAADIASDVASAVMEYRKWQSCKIGRSVNPQRLESAVCGIDGVTRATVSSITAGSTDSSHFVSASLTTVFGGYENE